MQAMVIAIAALGLIGATFFATRAWTLHSLTDKNFVFESFQRVDDIWLYSDKVGTQAASDLERARVALGGPLALSATETVYFVATQDGDGNPLTSSCTYQVSGGPIDTRWWSLTLYDSVTQHYVPNIENRSSWNSVSLPYDANDRWAVTVAPTPQSETWLPSQSVPEKPFDLMLRAYNPSDKLRDQMPNIELPTVKRLSC